MPAAVVAARILVPQLGHDTVIVVGGAGAGAGGVGCDGWLLPADDTCSLIRSIHSCRLNVTRRYCFPSSVETATELGNSGIRARNLVISITSGW